MNVRLLRKVKKHILAEPLRLRMANWVVRKRSVAKLEREIGTAGYWGEPPLSHVEFAKCGTAACIAGWTCILAGKSRVRYHGIAAQKLLGIDEDRANDLFIPCFWPLEFGPKYELAVTAEERATIAADRIEHFIKTGE